MNINSTVRSSHSSAPAHSGATASPDKPKPSAQEYPEPVLSGPFGNGIDGWNGPRDGKSQVKHQWLLRPVGDFLVAANTRVEVKGAENLPHEGKHVYCPTHPTYMDPPIVATLTKRDMRYISAQNVFSGLRGQVMSVSGAFPTDLNHARTSTIRHAVDMVEQGKGFCIFPEGKISDAKDKVDRLKRGAATIAHWGGAESIVPISITYGDDTKSRIGERVAGFLTTGLMVAGTVAATGGGPLVKTVMGALNGAVAATFASGTVAHKQAVPDGNDNIKDPFPKLFARLQWGALGALAGGALGALGANLGPATLPLLGLAGATGAVGLTEAWATRPVAHVTIGEPMKVAPYFEGKKTKEGAENMTRELHRTLGHLKAEQTGVPYDEESHKVFDRSVDPPIGVGWTLD